MTTPIAQAVDLAQAWQPLATRGTVIGPDPRDWSPFLPHESDSPTEANLRKALRLYVHRVDRCAPESMIETSAVDVEIAQQEYLNPGSTQPTPSPFKLGPTPQRRFGIVKVACVALAFGAALAGTVEKHRRDNPDLYPQPFHATVDDSKLPPLLKPAPRTHAERTFMIGQQAANRMRAAQLVR